MPNLVAKNKYIVIVDEQIEKFEQRVAEAMDNGWSLVGGVQVTIINNKIFYFQAISGVVHAKKVFGK
ncbi:MAG: DUF1737 domain-containing protein [Bacteroidota bacterium]